ncbi:hypothetical protein [Chryseobacterium viscerum]|uniref:hypothetical protein n=1 Tax=Chryseobacterium viscerum TaxID=1037377 RepID=UPI001401E8A4|nr:hypothetical protein [Chryseobacterium viscerum]
MKKLVIIGQNYNQQVTTARKRLSLFANNDSLKHIQEHVFVIFEHEYQAHSLRV